MSANVQKDMQRNQLVLFSIHNIIPILQAFVMGSTNFVASVLVPIKIYYSLPSHVTVLSLSAFMVPQRSGQAAGEGRGWGKHLKVELKINCSLPPCEGRGHLNGRLPEATKKLDWAKGSLCRACVTTDIVPLWNLAGWKRGQGKHCQH